jgi:hypothetical protein
MPWFPPSPIVSHWLYAPDAARHLPCGDSADTTRENGSSDRRPGGLNGTSAMIRPQSGRPSIATFIRRAYSGLAIFGEASIRALAARLTSGSSQGNLGLPV